MYQYLTGRLVEKNPASLVLDVQGIGYHILIPVSTFTSLPEINQNIKILTHFIVREDAHVLFGFATEEERDFFRLLISVSGIGPKTAMTVLSGISIPELKRALIEGNLAVLTSAPGIGRKTAERMIVELREKIVVEEGRGLPATGKILANQALAEDGVRALVELGYRKQNAQEAIQKVFKNQGSQLSVSDLVRASLKYV